jgi:hypothetical protein
MSRRDKKGITLLMVFNGEKINKTPINDFAILGFSQEKTKILQDFYKPYYMDCEIILEAAEDFGSLKKKLLDKGFRNLPVSNQAKFVNWKKENPKNFIKLQKIMLQKKIVSDRK